MFRNNSFFLAGLIATFATLMFGKAAFPEGGRGVGNGGDVAVCNEGGKETVVLYDYLEAHLLRKDWKLGLGPSSLSVQDKLDIVFSRLQKFSPDRVILYRNTIKSILDRNPFVDYRLEPVQDVKRSLKLPPECHLEQVAIHLFPQYDFDHQGWVIDRRLYSRMNNDSKAGLLLHEAIYAEMAQLGFDTSNGPRYLTMLFSSDGFADLPLPTFVLDLVSAGMRSFEYRGLELRLDPDALQAKPTMPNIDALPLFYPNGNVREGFVVIGSPYRLQSGDIIRVSGKALFYESGPLSELRDPSVVMLSLWGENIFFQVMDFDLQGNLSGGCVYGPRSLMGSDGARALGEYYRIKITPDGQLQEARSVDSCP